MQEILFVGGVPYCNFVLYKIVEGRRLPRRMKGLGESIRQRGNLRVDSGIRILRSPTEIFEGGGTEPPMHAYGVGLADGFRTDLAHAPALHLALVRQAGDGRRHLFRRNIRIGAMLVGRGAVHGLSFFVEKIYKRKNRRKARICLTFAHRSNAVVGHSLCIYFLYENSLYYGNKHQCREKRPLGDIHLYFSLCIVVGLL